MFLRDLKAVYKDSWTFALACPALFAIPLVVEFVQHVVEIQAGMYAGKTGAMAAEGDPLRMQFGFIKVLAIMLPGYWVTRFILFGRDARRAGRIEMPAFALWLVTFAIMAFNAWLGLFGPSLADLIGIGDSLSPWFQSVTFVIETAITIYLAAWFVAWSVGNSKIGPITSVGIMHGSFWHALGLYVGAFLPLMIVHYALAIIAVLILPPALDWVAMAVDSVIVAFLAASMAGATAYGAKRAAARKVRHLLPDQREDAATLGKKSPL